MLQYFSSLVVTRDVPTPLAFLVMKVNVDSNGFVTTQLSKAIEDVEVSAWLKMGMNQ